MFANFNILCIKAAPSTRSRKNHLLLAIISNFIQRYQILPNDCLIGLCIHLLLFSEINKINMNYFDFRFNRARIKLCTKPNYGN